jgi:hypothetical protein
MLVGPVQRQRLLEVLHGEREVASMRERDL